MKVKNELPVYVERNISDDAETPIRNFEPISHSYSLPNEYSRAEKGLLIYPVSKLRLTPNVALNRGLVNNSWEVSGFRLEDLVTASIALKNGNLSD